MKNRYLSIFLLGLFTGAARPAPAVLRVVTTLLDYASIAKAIGGDRVDVQAIVRGEQDAHFIRPKPSFVSMVRRADVLVDTGLDLEMWLPTVIDKSGNIHVRSGQPGYVAAAAGLHLLEKPKTFSRIEGGVHIYGNPHITCSPVNMRTVARNIAAGLITNDPGGRKQYEQGCAAFVRDLDERLFGPELVELIGGNELAKLAEEGRLIDFLGHQTYAGAPLLDRLGGWMREMLPLRGTPIATYHKGWVYFLNLFGLKEAGTIEPKPGIPPSPRHVLELVESLRKNDVRLLLAANYFDEQKVRRVADRVGAEAVLAPAYVGGAPGIETYPQLVDLWVRSLRAAAAKKGLIEEAHP